MSKYKSRSEVPEKYKWDLSDFYTNDKTFNADLEKAKKRIEEESKFKGTLKNSKKLYEFLKYDEETLCLVENLYVYSFMKDDEELGNNNNINRKNKALSVITDYANSVSFFNPELLSLSKEEYNELFKNKDLDIYKFALDEIYKNKDHILSEREEVIVNELISAMDNFDVISSNLINNEHDYGTITIDGKEEEIHATNFRKIMKNKDSKIREKAFLQFKEVLNRYGGTSAFLLNSYVKENNSCAKIHHFKNAWERKLFDYDMPQKAYDTLIDTVEKHLDSLHNYYSLFKIPYNLDKVHTYDLYLDLASSNKKYSIEEGIELIRKAITPLGEEYMSCFNKIIDNHYIDYCEYKGKTAGGYSVSTPDHDSRILMSFNDDLSSVSVIAHEAGHNINHQYIKDNNPIIYRETTSLTGEITSLTNECLLSSYLAEHGSKEEKLEGISNILDVIEGNLFGSVREGKMELDFYKYIENGNALTKEYMNQLSLDSLKKYLGKDVVIDKYAETDWIRRSHYYMNFYMFDYAFCISCAISNAAKILSGDKEQLKRYIKFLSIGGDIYPIDAIKILGFDLTDKKVYEDAIKYFDELIEKYKKISKE